MSEKKTMYKILNKEEKNKIINLEIELPYSELEKNKSKVTKKLGEQVEIKGFRKGTAPEKIITEQVGPAKVMEEMAYQAIIDHLPEIAKVEKINALTQPKISITKLAENNPLVFKADFVLMPEINIADYKAIAKSIKIESDAKVEDKEIDEYIDYIRKSRAQAEALKKKTSEDPKEREEANKKENKEPKLPEFNDEFVKTLGDFKDVADFKKQLKENMVNEKQAKANDKRKIEIMEKIIKESNIELPDLLIEEELNRMMHQFQGDLEGAKMNIDDYLKEIKKTKDDLLKEWRPDAVKRTKMNLILPKIALEEKIEVDSKKVDHEVKHLLEHHKDLSEEQAKSYVAHMLKNNAVFKFLVELT